MSMLRSGRLGVRIPAPTQIFLSSKSSRPVWGPLSPLFDSYWVYFPRVKQPGCDVDHSSPSGAEVQNQWSHTSTPPVRIYAMDTGDFIFWRCYLASTELRGNLLFIGYFIQRHISCTDYFPLCAKRRN